MFLTAIELANRIRKIMNETDGLFVTAFIGKDYESDLLSFVRNGGRIVCDISMGATKSSTLKKLRDVAPSRVKHLRGLHSKVAIGVRECIISSANLSGNALGVAVSPPKLTEAGILLDDCAADAFLTCREWGERIFAEAERITDDDLAWLAMCNISRPKDLGKEKPGSFMWRFGLDPRFGRETKIVVTVVTGNLKVVAEAKDVVKVEGSSNVHGISSNHYFIDWGLALEDWPENFIAIHWGIRGGVYINEYSKIVLEAERDVLFVRSLRNDKNDVLLGDLKEFLSNRSFGYEQVIAALGGRDGRIMTIAEFSNFLESA